MAVVFQYDTRYGNFFAPTVMNVLSWMGVDGRFDGTCSTCTFPQAAKGHKSAIGSYVPKVFRVFLLQAKPS